TRRPRRMETVARVADLRRCIGAVRAAGKTIRLVPTMGAFHGGHLELIRAARRAGGFVGVSLFVNPIQFRPGEDFARYPRDPDGDRRAAEAEGVDLLFEPAVEEVYPPGYQSFVEVERLTRSLCGASRPGHFRGVTTVVTKLFQMAQPDFAYFGEKDFQQLRVIEQ